MAKVILLCGKIASGKTYYAAQLCQNGRAVLLSCDELMLTLFDSCLGARHDDVLHRSQRYFYTLAEQLAAADVDTVLDFGFWTREERGAARAYFCSRGIDCELRYIVTPEERRLAQLNDRNARLANCPTRSFILDDDTRARLDAKFEEPGADEVGQIVENR